MRTLQAALVLYFIVLAGCIGAGTLGGFDDKTFHTSKRNLVQAIDTLYSKHPEYKMPDKWKAFDSWKQRGYDFLDSRIFYFNSNPEEMYYVSFIYDANDTTYSATIAIRAINSGTGHWSLENETSSSEKKRIEARFDNEIISKLERYTQSTQ